MKTEKIKINGIPSVIYGEPSKRAYFFIHGKCGYKEEAERFSKIARGYQVLSVDLPEHGERREECGGFNPWTVCPEIKSVFAYMRQRWEQTGVRANSIGAYFAMLALGCETDVKKALFVSPLLDMQKLICSMMKMADVTERQLCEKGEINTSFGQTLSWKYLCYAREHSTADWAVKTDILWADGDDITNRETVENFAAAHNAKLTEAENCEHWFHTEYQISLLEKWERNNILF